MQLYLYQNVCVGALEMGYDKNELWTYRFKN